MKKFVSMAMVAAMTVSMVPATAFAGDDFEGTAKVVNVKKVRDDEVKKGTSITSPELQIKLTDVTTQASGGATGVEFTVALDGATFKPASTLAPTVELRNSDNAELTGYDAKVTVDEDAEEATVNVWFTDADSRFRSGDYIAMDLLTEMEGKKDAFVAVESDDITLSNDSVDMVFVDVMDEGIEASVAKLAKVAEEEATTLEKDLKIESSVGDFAAGQTLELKLSNGFEFVKSKIKTTTGANYTLTWEDEDTVKVKVGKKTDKIEIKKGDITIEATDAKEGDIATLKVKTTSGFKASTSVEVVEVTDYNVVMSVDEDQDVPVFYSGVDRDNTGLTDDTDHISLEVTIEETFPGAWNMAKGFNLELPEGVYVVDMDVTGGATALEKGKSITVEEAFEDAYQEGEHKAFEFGKRVFAETEPGTDKDGHELTFELELVADPGFVGDVNLKLTGDALDEQEVTIATFATPYYAVAEQNDLKIDYRYTAVPSEIVITEAEAGLWKEDAYFTLKMEHADENFFEFEDAEVTVDEESGMEIDDKVSEGSIKVTVEEESDEPATITISNMEMFMSRSIPAGPYDLDAETTMGENYLGEKLFAFDNGGVVDKNKHGKDADGKTEHDSDECEDHVYLKCVSDYSDTVKEAFINVVTAGRDQDDASFKTKVVVPVGESYIVSGETTVELDVPAYVSEAGYTMLPVRAVAKALGINNNNVMWDGTTKTVTILYGQRIITMVAGQKVINVNGSAIPASAAVEIVDDRTFLPMRDLGTALGVTDIAWDAATKTATLNGGAAVVAE